MNSLGYGKMAQTAISAMSHLAIHYDEGGTRYRADQVSEARNLPRPIIAKVLSKLAQTDYVHGTAGPGGGYTLVVPPEAITFFDIVTLFEPLGDPPFCPFGPEWCGTQNPCAVHDQLQELHQSVRKFLEETHFGMFKNPET